METVTIEGREGKKTAFRGELLTPLVSTYSDDRARWVEFRLYRREGGGFVVHRAGMSLVYHQLDGPCRNKDGTQSGFPTPASELPEDAEPCRQCDPPWPEVIPSGARVRFEAPRHTVTRCRTASEAVKALTWDNKTKSHIWSAPVIQLVREAAEKAEEFALLVPEIQEDTVRL